MLDQLYYKWMLLVGKINSFTFLQSFFYKRFYLILLVIVLVHLKNATYKSMLLCALINLPGTILHETMHFIVGLLLNAKPCNFTLMPRRNENGYVMGSVGFTNITFYNAIPSSMAPLMLLPIGFYLNRYFLPTMTPTVTNYILYVLLQTIIIENAMPSAADFKVARMHFLGIILYAGIAAGLIIIL